MNSTRMEKVKRCILAKYPSAEATIETFDSGAAMLDVRLGARFFVCSFTPSQGYGIDEVLDEGGLTSSFEHSASDEEGAINILIALIETPK